MVPGFRLSGPGHYVKQVDPKPSDSAQVSRIGRSLAGLVICLRPSPYFPYGSKLFLTEPKTQPLFTKTCAKCFHLNSFILTLPIDGITLSFQ